jgi:hypothetical protein
VAVQATSTSAASLERVGVRIERIMPVRAGPVISRRA